MLLNTITFLSKPPKSIEVAVIYPFKNNLKPKTVSCYFLQTIGFFARILQIIDPIRKPQIAGKIQPNP